MRLAPLRDLRNSTSKLLRQVEAGESITITSGGRPVAVLGPIEDRPRWISKDEFISRIVSRQADWGLAKELAELAPDTTDDIPL